MTTQAVYDQLFDADRYEVLTNVISGYLGEDKTHPMVTSTMWRLSDVARQVAEKQVIPADARAVMKYTFPTFPEHVVTTIVDYLNSFLLPENKGKTVFRYLICVVHQLSSGISVIVDISTDLPVHDEYPEYHKVVFAGFTVLLLVNVPGGTIARPFEAASAIVNFSLGEHGNDDLPSPDELTLAQIEYVSDDWFA